jgi:hypothetical protein
MLFAQRLRCFQPVAETLLQDGDGSGDAAFIALRAGNVDQCQCFLLFPQATLSALRRFSMSARPLRCKPMLRKGRMIDKMPANGEIGD